MIKMCREEGAGSKKVLDSSLLLVENVHFVLFSEWIIPG